MLAGACLSTAAAQPARTPHAAQTFRSGVDLIEVDVRVLDRDRRPIIGLQAADFSVTVDGESRAVVQAQFVSLPPAR